MATEPFQEIVQSVAEGSGLDQAAEAYATLGEAERGALLATLKDVKTEAAGTFLGLLASTEPSKPLRKEIKRLLFRLKSAGVTVGDLAPEGPPILKKVEEPRLHRAFVSNYDPMGTRVVMLALETKRNRFGFFHGVTHFSEGLRELASGTLKRAEVENILKEYGAFTRKPLALAPVSPAYAAFLLEEASAASARYADEARQVARFVDTVPDGTRRPDDVFLLPVEGSPEPLAPEALLAEDLFEPFVLQWPAKDDDRKAYDGLAGSTILLPGHMVQERKNTFLKDLLRRDDFAPIVKGMKRLLEDYAYMFYGLGRTAAYRGLVEALGNPEFPAETVLFYVKRELGTKKEEAAEPGLIVSPYGQVRR